MGLLQEWEEIRKMNEEIKTMLGIKTIDVKYIKSEQAITVKKGNSNE